MNKPLTGYQLYVLETKLSFLKECRIFNDRMSIHSLIVHESGGNNI